MSKNIGFVSTRFAGLDGVSLEANKWAEVLERSGHTCFWLAGELEAPPGKSFLVPEAHFKHPVIAWINEQVFGKIRPEPSLAGSIHALGSYLNIQLQQFIDHFKIDLLIIENALALPLNIPLGIALVELISAFRIPAIAHHHDFYWERDNLTADAGNEYINLAFPPNLPDMEHIVLNSLACEELARRKGIQAAIIPNVLDFENPPLMDENGSVDFRKLFSLRSGDRTILQPTRIIQRKGIEHAVALVRALDNPNYKLLLSHRNGDESNEYLKWLKNFSRENGIDLRLSNKQIISPWNKRSNSNGCSLWDVYIKADFVTFPSIHEGFGNALLEAIYLKKPMLINRYATFVRDVEPKGFDLIAIDGHLAEETIERVREVLESPQRQEKMVDTNYEIAKEFYSYSVLKERLDSLLLKLAGGKREGKRPKHPISDARVYEEV